MTLNLLRPDGSVVIPPALAGEVLRRLARSMIEEAREAGVAATPQARALLTALAESAQIAADDRQASSAAAGAAISVREAADRMGCSTRWIRHLLAHGRLPGRRAGGVWLVLPNSEASAGVD